MSRSLAGGLLAAVAMAQVAAPAAADVPAAEQRAQTVCAGCHGPDGISVNPLYPSLAGQQEAYLAKAIRDYRDGKRVDPLMSAMAHGLGDQDIEALAAYFAGLPRGR
jgi:cytochrome c553